MSPDRIRLGIGDINIILDVDENPARPAELRLLLDEASLLIEDLDAIVVSVSDEQPPFGIERQTVRRVELAGSNPFLSPALDEFSIL